MFRILKALCIVLALVVVLGSTMTASAANQASKAAAPQPADPWTSVCEPDGYQSSGAIYRICMPESDFWYNGNLVIWAHGYVAYNEDIHIPEDQLCPFEDLCINDVANILGYGFATTSYSENGLAVLPGMADIIDLVDIYAAAHGQPESVFLIGASEGGLITTLLVEQYPDIFDAGLALCGPIGSFPGQVNYIGDFRGIFDYFFAEQLDPPMGDPLVIPQWLIDDWYNYYPDVIEPVITDPANDSNLRQLFSVTKAPYDPTDFASSVLTTTEGVLWYDVFATNNGVDVLGGIPYDNHDRWYSGSLDDELLNNSVQRVTADPAALEEMHTNYNTTGHLDSPLVTMHTVGDQIVPYWHEPLYMKKTIRSGDFPLRHWNIPIYDRYGHCAFEVKETLLGFVVMLLMAWADPPTMDQVSLILPDPADQAVLLRQVDAQMSARLRQLR